MRRSVDPGKKRKPLAGSLLAWHTQISGSNLKVQNSKTTQKRGFSWLFVVFGLLLAAGPIRNAMAVGSASANVKAAFLFNFTRLTTWPASSFKTPSAPVVVGILGQDPDSSVIDAFMRGKKVGMRPLVTRRIKSAPEAKGVHVLYISPSMAGSVPGVLGQVGSLPVLTIGDVPGFAAKGGHLGFYEQGGAVKFEANVTALKKAGLGLNSKLLSLARIVR